MHVRKPTTINVDVSLDTVPLTGGVPCTEHHPWCVFVPVTLAPPSVPTTLLDLDAVACIDLSA
ncbi:MAG TPA: hypothetical protein VGO92_14090 [Acidimicrobiales bacterium]|nr:hypothetical protein [Acidimicrobiales bacterium]